jgi:UDP-N-acetylmuramate--alanine ligase
MISSLKSIQKVFFIGVAGTGMSALAQYLRGMGKDVSGSDRYFQQGEPNETRRKLEEDGITCFAQDGSGLDRTIDLVVVSTAVEDSVPEVAKAKEWGIPIMKRSELLALITATQKTIAVGGTSGKSTTAAMIFEILSKAGMSPGIISGAGLTALIRAGKIGNAQVGKGEWLVVEADESDGSIIQYHPAVGLLLNIDKDHKEIDELTELFRAFREHSEKFIVNQGHPLCRPFSRDSSLDFSTDNTFPAGYQSTGFDQKGLQISFEVKGTSFVLQTPGRHNMENALAAIAVTHQLGVPLSVAADALKHYEGIYRRHQVIGKHQGVWLIDDYAHNPAKCAASIAACQALTPKVIAWFQPHGYGPTRFLRKDYVKEIAQVLREQDEIWMSEIFYAGGTATKDISAEDLVNDLIKLGKNAYFVSDREQLLPAVRKHFTDDCVLLLMGARDPGLEQFASRLWKRLTHVS